MVSEVEVQSFFGAVKRSAPLNNRSAEAYFRPRWLSHLREARKMTSSASKKGLGRSVGWRLRRTYSRRSKSSVMSLAKSYRLLRLRALSICAQGSYSVPCSPRVQSAPEAVVVMLTQLDIKQIDDNLHIIFQFHHLPIPSSPLL